ncbi:hypothetical protein FALBO_944 [Fusarium albosuccineum]|uniref:Uncharacterized protein n=1 Tax=Fusarium albosuccineum TaxID=1237068 RepID=A0A8H4PIR9_9HYPO|nr:hypothetical protein FALBO_944 [Fusarium albosuccineum]
MPPKADKANKAPEGSTGKTAKSTANEKTSLSRLPVLRDETAIREQEASIINCILPQAKNHTVYKDVVDKIKSTSAGKARKWADTTLCKNFSGWVESAADEDRPALVFLLAALAAHECLAGTSVSKFRAEVSRRRLKAWAIEQLEGPRCSTSSETEVSTPKAPPVLQNQTTVKVEEGADAQGASCSAFIRQSIETGGQNVRTTQAHFAPRLRGNDDVPFPSVNGSKRKAVDELNQIPHKHTMLDVERQAIAAQLANEAIGASRTRVVLREVGTQTDDDMFASWAANLASQFTTESMKREFEAVSENTRALAELPKTLQELVEKTVQEAVRRAVGEVAAAQSAQPVETTTWQRPQAWPPQYGLRQHPAQFYESTPEPPIREVAQARAGNNNARLTGLAAAVFPLEFDREYRR